MTITYAGVDWLTMTTNDDQVGMAWFRTYEKYRKQKLEETDQEKPFNNGYYAGLGIASMRWGYSERIGYLLIVSGGEADQYWQQLQPAKQRVTRLDLCVDFVLKNPEDLAKRYYERFPKKVNGSRRKFSLFENSYGGATCYIGSRQSQQYGRFYDKGIQSGTHEKGLKWRAEVEYKKPLAGLMAKKLAARGASKRHAAIVATVAAWYSARGAGIHPLVGAGEPMELSVEQRITTAEKKLAWLRTQVSPTVVELVEAGYGSQVLRCLMLDQRALQKANVREDLTVSELSV